MLGHWCLESPAMLTPAPVSCGSQKLPSPSHPGCRTERLPPSVISLTTCDLTQNGPAQKGLWLPNQMSFGNPAPFLEPKMWNLPLIPECLRVPVLACRIESLDCAVDSALTTTDKPALPCSSYSFCSCEQSCFKLAFSLVIQAVGNKTCFEFLEMQPFLKWPCLCVTLNVM